MSNLRSYKSLYDGSQRIWQQFVATKDSNAIIKTAYEVIGRPIIINAQIVHFKSIGVRSNHIIDKLYTFGDDIARANAGKAAICPSDKISWLDPQLSYGYADAGVFRNGTYLGRVIILGGHSPLTGDDLEYAEILAQIMATIFADDIYPKINGINPQLPLFHSLMSGETLDSARVDKQLEALKISPERGMNIIVIEQRSHSILSAETNLEAIRKMLNCKLYALYRGNIVIINNRAPNQKLAIGKTVQKYLSDFGLRCGVSREFFQLSNVPRFYLQAIFALHVGSFFGVSSTVIDYENYSTEHSICQMCKNADPFYALDPRLIKLKEFDEAGPNCLMETLDVHVQNMKSPTAGANVLKIHRNTYFYRLNKISEITGWDLNDGYCIAKVAFYLKAIKLLDQAGSSGYQKLAELAELT